MPFATSSKVPFCNNSSRTAGGPSSSLLMGAPRKLGAAAEALQRARERKSTPQQAPSSPFASSAVATSVSPKSLPVNVFRPVVLAIRASNVTNLADVLPCGHIVERYCSMTTTPTAAGLGTATWEPHLLYEEAVREGKIPHPTPFSKWDIEPYTIPNVKRHEDLLRRAYRRAVESLSDLDSTAPPLSPPPRTVHSSATSTTRVNTGVSPPLTLSSLDKELMSVFGELGRNKSKYGRENLLRSLQAPASRRDALLSRFPSEDAFIDFLHRCAAKVDRALQNAEDRYFNSNLLGREVNGGQTVLTTATTTSALSTSSSGGDDDASGTDSVVMGPVVLVDTLEELALATSLLWKCLVQSRDEISKKMMVEAGVGKDMVAALLHQDGGGGVRRSGFYSYGGADTDVLQNTIGVVIRGRTQDDIASSANICGDPLHSSAVLLHQLSTFLDAHPELTCFRDRLINNTKNNENKSSSNTSSPQTPSMLLTSKYDISMRDITSHTRFRSSGLVQRKGRVPKLVNALGMLEPSHGCAMELHRTAAVDVHNPLWDAAALAAVCTFVLND